MSKQDALAKLHEGFKILFPDANIRLVVARDEDVSVIVISSNVRIWNDPEQSTDWIAELKENKQYYFTIVNLPEMNSRGKMMLPVRWQGKIGWINREWLKGAKITFAE